MAQIFNHDDVTTSWLADQDIPAGSHRIEFNAVDDSTNPTAQVEIWARITDPEGDVAHYHIPAAQSFEKVLGPSSGLPSGWKYSVKAATGTADVEVTVA